VRSHWHALSQSMLLQAFVPLQLIVHRVLSLHVMLLQLRSPLHVIVQVHPEGQVIWSSQSSGALQLTVQVRALSLHSVQSFGQFWTMQ